jgi:hypothetical protein
MQGADPVMFPPGWLRLSTSPIRTVPNEAYDLYKKLTISPERGITCLQECERSAAHSRVF